jgi:aspartyl-tRNA(Asn)/glutamyl-tRNA(Gln) amidotransferase subunit A
MDERELCYLPATELSRLYGLRELSPVEVTRAVLQRIETVDPTLNAFVTVTAELATEQALRAEREILQGRQAPLTGVPVSLKDLTPTRGIRTTRGSRLWADWVPDYDAPIAERVYAAGAVLLGKTNTPELGWKGETSNSVAGTTHNPWLHGRTAGGSSGGAAAAVAAGMGPLAQGTDGAGSIRIPASFCGVYGLKPSYGLVPYYPSSAVESLAHGGPITRTVRDAGQLLNALAGPDARDRNSLNATGIDYLAACEGDIAGLRIAWSPTLGFAPVEPEILQIVAAAVDTFRALGCEIIEVDAHFDDPFPTIDAIWASGQAAGHVNDFERVRDLIDPGRARVVEHGFTLSGVDVALAAVQRGQFYEQMRLFFEPFDLLLTPTMPITAFAAGEDFPTEVAGQTTSYLSWTPYTYPFNLTGQPAATVPCGFDHQGLPVGLQIVGRWRDDVTVLRASAAFEAARPWQHNRPPLG